MPTDFTYDDETNLRINERGVIDEVDGVQNERQQAALRVSNAIGDVPSKPVTRAELERIETEITDALRDSNYIESVLGVSVVEVSDGNVVFDVQTATSTQRLTATA
jgi:hemolysin activation/secretion protein